MVMENNKGKQIGKRMWIIAGIALFIAVCLVVVAKIRDQCNAGYLRSEW